MENLEKLIKLVDDLSYEELKDADGHFYYAYTCDEETGKLLQTTCTELVKDVKHLKDLLNQALKENEQLSEV